MSFSASIVVKPSGTGVRTRVGIGIGRLTRRGAHCSGLSSDLTLLALLALLERTALLKRAVLRLLAGQLLTSLLLRVLHQLLEVEQELPLAVLGLVLVDLDPFAIGLARDTGDKRAAATAGEWTVAVSTLTV